MILINSQKFVARLRQCNVEYPFTSLPAVGHKL